MRKSITIPNQFNDVIRKFSEVCNVSESAVISYAINLLTTRFNFSESINEEKWLIGAIQHFYENIYVKILPRGKKARRTYEKKKTT